MVNTPKYLRELLTASAVVKKGDPMTRLRGVCPVCGKRTLHFYPQGDTPDSAVFLSCECGYRDLSDRNDELIKCARPFRPHMFANGYFRGLARTPRVCPKCGATPLEFIDMPNPNMAHEICHECGYMGTVYAPITMTPRGWDERKRAEEDPTSHRKDGKIVPFKPRHRERSEVDDEGSAEP